MKFKYTLVVVPFLICLSACKKQSTLPFENSKTLIVGKWFVKSFKSRLYYNGAEIDSSFISSFTNADFAQYFTDGTGIQSVNAKPAPNLSLFTYTINGNSLTQTDTGNTQSIPETITILTSTNLSLNYQVLIADPSSGRVYTSKDYYDFAR
jgi:hypothetical protein